MLIIVSNSVRFFACTALVIGVIIWLYIEDRKKIEKGKKRQQFADMLKQPDISEWLCSTSDELEKYKNYCQERDGLLKDYPQYKYYLRKFGFENNPEILQEDLDDAQNNRIPVILKYSNLKPNEETFEELGFCIDWFDRYLYFSAHEQGIVEMIENKQPGEFDEPLSAKAIRKCINPYLSNIKSKTAHNIFRVNYGMLVALKEELEKSNDAILGVVDND